MNAKTFLIALVVAMAHTASATTPPNDGTITIRANKASRGLVEKWIEVYRGVNPNVQIVLVSGRDAEADLTLVNGHGEGREQVAYVARYALLPVTSTDNPLLDDIRRREWRSRDIKHLFFIAEDEEEEEYEKEEEGKRSKLSDKLTVYSGNSKASFAGIFAAHFGRNANDLRGNRIVGDDLYLLSAIEEDKASVTFNPLSNLYDLSSRTLKSDLVLLPLAVKKAQGEALRSGNLDKTLELMEHENVDLIPVEEFGFAYETSDSDIEQFLHWVVSEGQQYNHQLGFLRLGEKL